MKDAARRPYGPVGGRSLRDVLKALPKVDLHRHLEGSLRLSTLAEVAKEHGVDLPSYDIEKLRPYVQMTDDPPDFHTFLSKFRLLRRFYSTQEAVERLAYEAVADAAADNVTYLELRFSPVSIAMTQRFPIQDVADWVIRSADRSATEHGITVRYLMTIVREFDFLQAEEVVNLAIAYRDRGVVGIDLAGDEVRFSGAPFAPLFKRAHAAGLFVTVHAGEAMGPERVQEAIEVLEADRIGHGVRSIENSDVIYLLIRNQIPLEICPTSNIQTGVVQSFGMHPLYDLYQLGVIVTLNTDDPSVSNTTLSDEYFVAIRGIGLSLDDLYQVILNGARAAFLPPKEKERLEQSLARAMGLKKGPLPWQR